MLVTTYCHAKFVREALESLRQQTSQDFETIITDDASPDGTADVIQAWLDETGFPARFIRNPRNRGICANRNTAIGAASGRYICSLSGDDAYLPDRIATQLAQFDSLGDDVAALYGDATLIDEAGQDLGVNFLHHQLQGEALPADLVAHLACRGNFIPAPAVMVRRSALVSVGLYDESLIYEDLDMWLRLAQRYRFVHRQGAVMRYRVVASSLSHAPQKRPAMLASEFRILAKCRKSRPDLYAGITDRMWELACRLTLAGHDRLARPLMTEIARSRTQLRRRLLALSVSLTGNGAVFRRLSGLYRQFRGGGGVSEVLRPPTPTPNRGGGGQRRREQPKRRRLGHGQI